MLAGRVWGLAALVADPGEFGVVLVPDQGGQFAGVALVERPGGGVGGGAAAAPPVHECAARAPGGAVVFADCHDKGVRLSQPFPGVAQSQRKLPAYVGFCRQRLTAFAEREEVQRASRASREAVPVQEDAGSLDDSGTAVAAVFAGCDGDALGLSDLAELPQLAGQPPGTRFHPLPVVAVRPVGADRAAPLVLSASPGAAVAVDAIPVRGKPCQIAAVNSRAARLVREIQPFPGGMPDRLPAWLAPSWLLS